MILDSFKLHTAIVQISYSDAFEIWDRAGAIARRLTAIWPDLELANGQPQQQVLQARGVQIETGFTQSTITLKGEGSLEPRKIQQIKDSFEVWRQLLALDDLKRVSTRAVYAKEFPSIKAANADLLKLNLVKWPTIKVFDQPIDSELNGVEINYRFEDAESFSLLRLKAEQVKFEATFDPEFADPAEIRKIKCRVLIDFDRGLLGSVNAEKLRMEDWLKGFHHLLRRDIEKVLKGQS